MGPPMPSGIDVGGAGAVYIAPGFIDLHVHGGADADFMDGTADAFLTVCRAHATSRNDLAHAHQHCCQPRSVAALSRAVPALRA